jgi:hypothetical protein
VSKKRRISVRIHNDEAVVVAPVGFWEGLESLFHDIAAQKENSPNKTQWLAAADHVSGWVGRTKTEKEKASEDW